MFDKIAENIRDNFGDVDIFTEEVDEGICYPCFFIRLVNADIKREFKGLLIVDEFYSVSYLPGRDNVSNDEIFKLLRCLETVDGLRSRETSVDIVKDEVGSTVVCTAVFNKRFRELGRDEYMMRLKQRALSRV